MRTPAGTECKFFYGNYFRGRKQEECRAIGNAPAPYHWTPDLCRKCPIPGVLHANACHNMEIQAGVNRSLFGLVRSVKADTFCTLCQQEVNEPYIGCGQCHPLPPEFLETKP